MLSKATSNDDVPTSGYLLTEVAKLTRESPQTCAYVEDFLVDKLKSSSAAVKLKALKVMIFLCSNGSPNFRFDIRRCTDPIRNCTTFHGPPDALRGNAQYVAVRDAAKQLMDVLFQEEEPVKPTIATQASTSSDGQTMGSASHGVSSTFQGKSLVDKLQDKLANVAQKVHDFARGSEGKSNTLETDTSYSSHLYSAAKSKTTFSYSAKPTWSNADDSSDNYVPASATRDDGLQEKTLVDEITAPGGIRAVPPREKVVDFLRRSQSLNLDKIFEALQQKLQKTDVPQTLLKALVLIEAMLHSDIPDIEAYVIGLEGDLLVVCNLGQPTARTKAAKILQELNPDTTVGSFLKAETSVQQPKRNIPPSWSNTVIDNGVLPDQKSKTHSDAPLSSDEILIVPAEDESPSTATAHTNTSSSSTLFGGMTLKASDHGDDVLKPDVSTSDKINEVGTLFGSMDLNFLGGPTIVPNSSISAQQTVQELSLMPQFEADSDFDPLASSSQPVTSAISPAPPALAPQPVFVQSPPMSQPISSPQYHQFLPMGQPVYAPYGVQWSRPVHTYVPVQAMGLAGIGQQQDRKPRPTSSSINQGGFQFMASSSKAGAFDFVQDAMKQSLAKKEMSESDRKG